MKSNLTFKTFVQEETTIQNTTSGISIQDAADLIDKHCTAAWEQFAGRIGNVDTYSLEDLGPVLWRGFKRTTMSSILMDTTVHERTAANTTNFINLMVSNLPSWSKYPKRNRSAICTMDMNTASQYSYMGSIMLVFPFDGTEVGIAPQYDFWVSFRNHFNNVSQVSELYTDFLSQFVPEIVNVKHNNFQDLVTAMKMVDDRYKDLGREKFLEWIEDEAGEETRWSLMHTFEYDGNLMKSFETVLNPDNNGFTLTNAGHLPNSTKHEAWFSGKAVAIADDKLDELLRLMA